MPVRTQVDRTTSADRQRRANALGVLLSPRAWRHIAAAIGMLGFDTIEQDNIHKDKSVRMSPSVSVRNGTRISIGAGSEIGQGCHLWAGDTVGRIDIGSHALFAPNVFVTSSNYRFDDGSGPVMHQAREERDVWIGDNTWLGAGVVVVAGARIGHGAIVAAGAVVTGDIPDFSVAAGIPARVVRMRNEEPIASR
ncbi:MAG: acyltransferase [Actinobacteria bacterium]|nr:acyltransferase [Actinomycetota bacterium]